ncbi:indolepyruvate ferredoxin oxidoreductase family protein [Nitratireductor aquimarinus]|uniref:indolepyruvate ferredoxin oxidoreductase family protein n=1 Tax=Alphaproteobacteria TaxID=28211 RepID=UPI0019D3ED92|nr:MULTISPECIES: indolepyruvate ferredoxin oxidoreductase family protein [Alphaproteobacteria]MBN7756843.1 indolepyruvate ferredoxin oxidoreductase family protein [Nitratireductor aquimarinus]MBY5999540.1 indolepyruvate ferredoxin oxidoreductase family protein [Tritonibacter mobilis]MBY6021566.1 indolepyruvate ferredoxin oxidoreductase family protein [Nitratireductor sp. DP7N14-4]
MTLHDVALDDKYDLTKERIFVSGAQAVVRMLLMQRERDRRAGLNTAGFVSGYRGSPIGGLDLQLWKAKKQLEASNVIFQPGLNEELAATACWGSQQTELLGEGKYDGVFGVWYGKGPGVDRSGDVFRHANQAGSSKHGGVLALMGDDHTAESSTVANASEFAFVDAMIPILNPAGVQELIDYGLYGYALSRFAGTWTAIKCVKDNIESTAAVDVSLERLNIVRPEFDMPPGGLNIRNEINMLGQEARLYDYKRAAAAAFVQANNLNRIIYSGGSKAKIGIVTLGKSYLDTRQALDDLGIDEARANQLGIRLFKVACPWPFDVEHMRDFARGLDMVIVVEEKRSLIEVQLRENLYGTANQPEIIGKVNERGERLFAPTAALDPNEIAIAIGERILRVIGPSEEIAAHVSRLRQFQAMLADTKDVSGRAPYFCSGCPHNTSTNVPEGSIAGGGIGCHFMATWMDRSNIGFTAMGGEGAQFIGQAPFSKREHFFQNLGDGTYNHSGSMAIRFAIASGANITYKILYNDAVAMTGGQPHEGGLTVDMIADQVRAEGVERIAVVSDEPEKYAGVVAFPQGTTINHRDDLDQVQRDLREVKGVSVLLYDQTCAAEKRRRRKRGTFPDPDKRVFINELVCEGCGDCGVKSNCVSVQPQETEFGRKRRIDQSSCNKDFSCVNGFCPSFVTVHGAKLKKAKGVTGANDPLEGVPEPALYQMERGWSAVVDGIGGTGVVTIGAILGMAAHLEGKGAGIIDMAGLAQKGGAVFTHLRIAPTPEDIYAIRVSAGEADLVLGCDLVVSGAKKVLASARHGHTLFMANTAEVMPGDFARSADFLLPIERLKQAIRAAAGEEKAHFFDATRTASVLFGNSVGANMFMLGMAYQYGGLPVSAEAIEKAIELNGQAVSMNVSAFRWGRRAAHDPEHVRRLVAKSSNGNVRQPLSKTLDEVIERRATFLTGYQNAAYAERYRARIARLRAAEEKALPGSTAVTEAAARNLFKLMAIKDEYEVARLYTDGAFKRQLAAEFESYDHLEFHLAPPILGRHDAQGHPRKSAFGPWMMTAFRLLAGLKGLRGTALDFFGRTEERRMERRLLAEYEGDLDRIEALLSPERAEAAVALASVPSLIRGFGYIKEGNAEKAAGERARLRQRLEDGDEPGTLLKAAE